MNRSSTYQRVRTSLSLKEVLTGHSYGGSVLSDAAHDADNVKALGFDAALLPADPHQRRGPLDRRPGGHHVCGGQPRSSGAT